MSRKVTGLAVFIVAIAAAATGAFYLIDAGEDLDDASQDPVVVDFTRSGGFTGITQHLLVYSGGEAELTTGESSADARTIEFDLAPETLELLEGLLPEAVTSLDEEPQSGVGCADCYQYDLIYDDVRYTFFNLPRGKQTTQLLDVLDVAICEGGAPGGCSR